ncbi:MAG TPA: class II aldolase/adducin family protein [Vicinamibacterales bacterium]|nr:class II aldolase/adducin family protein [Vicinamibacterales bacterium]
MHQVMATKALLADAIRMLERAEIIDHSGHCSARRDAESYFINSGASVRSTLTADDIVTVDLNGSLIEGTARPPLEFHIHSEIYRARPDVNVVMHTHPRWSTLLTMVGVRFEPVYAQGVLLGEIPLMESPLSINTKAMGERLATTLGQSRAVLLKSHGAVVVGADIVECFALATYLEENARRQYLALLIGTPYVFSEAEQQACRANLWSPGLFKKSWDYFQSKPSNE